MRVFVLSTGRCGSTTFAKACHHITNFTAAHESRIAEGPTHRLAYPEDHIESDPRLAWFLGLLHERFPEAFYVHLTRDPDEVAYSYLQRFVQHPHPRGGGRLSLVRRRLVESFPSPRIMTGFAYSILMRRDPWPESTRLPLCRFYVDTVTANIHEFLKDKSYVTVRLERAHEDFRGFLHHISAEGDLEAAVAEWSVRHNYHTPR